MSEHTKPNSETKLGPISRDGNSGESPTSSDNWNLTRRSVLLAGGAIGAGVISPNIVRGSGTTDGETESGSPAPGPDVLYESLASAPQFENTDPWTAEPLLVSGTDAYVQGEYLFQDFVYDDKGATTTKLNEPPDPAPKAHTFSAMTGDVVYPTDEETYRNNAADVLEFRARPTETGIAYRVTLNTMEATDAAAIAIGINTDGETTTGADDWGYGIGQLGTLGLDHVLVTWGDGAELDGEPVESRVDLTRNQIHVEVPLDPGRETWRHYLVAGLYDSQANEFKQIQGQPTDTDPGGAHGKSPPPVFNVGFRFADDEPMGITKLDPERIGELFEFFGTEEYLERTESRGVGWGHWREHDQAISLAQRDISKFSADIDFGKLAEEVEEVNIPETGYLNRLYVSHFDLGTGIDEFPTSDDADVLLGKILPYSIYIPSAYDGSSPFPLHVHLHSLSGTYNQYQATMPNFIRQIGEERNAIVLTSTGRGPEVPFRDQAELDLFEAWGDANHRYELDFDRVTLGGFSMGAYSAHRIVSLYPDLFASAFPLSGSVGGSEDRYPNNEIVADNLRHVPLLMWTGYADGLVPLDEVLEYQERLEELGYRHELGIFKYDHFGLPNLDQWGPAKEFLTNNQDITRDPPQVTYRAVPAKDNEDYGLVHDKAYWVSDIGVTESESDGLVNVRSAAFGAAPPTPVKFHEQGEDPVRHIKQGIRWDRSDDAPEPRNALAVSLDRVSDVTLWVEEANLEPTTPIELQVETSHPATITLATPSATRELTFESGEATRQVTLSP